MSDVCRRAPHPQLGKVNVIHPTTLGINIWLKIQVMFMLKKFHRGFWCLHANWKPFIPSFLEAAAPLHTHALTSFTSRQVNPPPLVPN